jgi:hypothetical protein
MSTLHGDLCTFVILTRSDALGMSNISDKCCTENQNTYSRFFSENHALYKITWKTMVQPHTQHDNIIDSMSISYCITRARQTYTHTHTHTQNAQCSSLFYDNDGYANAHRCYIIHTLPVLLNAFKMVRL